MTREQFISTLTILGFERKYKSSSLYIMDNWSVMVSKKRAHVYRQRESKDDEGEEVKQGFKECLGYLIKRIDNG